MFVYRQQLLESIKTSITNNKVTCIFEKADYGKTKLSIREAITNAKNRMVDALYLTGTGNNEEYAKQRIKIAQEQLLNAYDDACAKYIDSKIDKVRFKKNIHK